MGYDFVCFTDGKKIDMSQIAGLLPGSDYHYLIGLDHQSN